MSTDYDPDAIAAQVSKALKDVLSTTPRTTATESIRLTFFNLRNEECHAELQIANGKLVMFQLVATEELAQRAHADKVRQEIYDRDVDETARAIETSRRTPSASTQACYDRFTERNKE